MKGFLAVLKNQTTSYALLIKYCRRFKKRSEIQPESTTFTFFINGLNILNIRLAAIKLSKTGYALWHRHYWHLKIKDSISAACSLRKNIWKVILYGILIGKRHLKLNILPGTANQAASMEDIIRKVWAKEVYYWQKASGTKTSALFFSSKNNKHMSLLIFYYINLRLPILI